MIRNEEQKMKSSGLVSSIWFKAKTFSFSTAKSRGSAASQVEEVADGLDPF